MPGGIVHVAADGAILEANAEALRVLGFTYDQLTQRYVKDFDPETIREDGTPCPASEYPVTRAIVTGQPQPPMVIGVRQRGGALTWAVFTAVPTFAPGLEQVTGAVVTFFDITQRKAAEAALANSESLLRSVLESAPNPVVTTDREGRMLLLTHPPSDSRVAVGQLAWEGLLDDEHPKSAAAFARVMSGGPRESYEVRAKSGRRWLVHLGPRREGGEIAGATYVAWDVTEMRELEARLAIADRMASIGTLVAGMGHEINNPLTYVLANLEWLKRQRGAVADPKELELIDGALEGAERIRQVVANLRSFSRTSEGGAGPVEVRPLLESALRLAHNELRHRAAVETRFGAVPRVTAPEGRLGQVFLNLLVNAAQAIPEGQSRDNRVTVTTRTDEAGRAVIEVSDTGMGIEPELLPRIFEPFVTTKPIGAGTGLGLFICRNVVQALGGEIDVRSHPGQGATFRVTLPPAANQVPAPEVPAQPAAAPSGKKLSILVVDDEESILRVMRELLSGQQVVVAGSGRQAIEQLEAREFDLVFCDLVMPELTGVEVHERLKALRPGHETRIVFMTGGAFTERTRRFLQESPRQVLLKPFTFAAVQAVLDSAMKEPGRR